MRLSGRKEVQTGWIRGRFRRKHEFEGHQNNSTKSRNWIYNNTSENKERLLVNFEFQRGTWKSKIEMRLPIIAITVGTNVMRLSGGLNWNNQFFETNDDLTRKKKMWFLKVGEVDEFREMKRNEKKPRYT